MVDHLSNSSSSQFKLLLSRKENLLEQVCDSVKNLLRIDESKIDFESESGHSQAKKCLRLIEKLAEALGAKTADRSYRGEFTKAYQVLYKPRKLCYLVEIIDSAQESNPHIYVNSEKYEFSNEVLRAARRLFRAFEDLLLKIQLKQSELVKVALQSFDESWANYEYMYVLELMVIEADARRYIRKAGSLDKELCKLEKQSKQGKVSFEDYNEKRKKLVKLIGKINSVANTDGTGRDDLSVEILLASETLARKFSNLQLSTLAGNVKTSFVELRQVFREYAKNIEEVDPQLKNNKELTDALLKFESAWAKGKEFFLEDYKRKQLIFFSMYLKNVIRKFPSVKEQIEYREAEVLFAIPSLLVLRKLEKEDRNTCISFCPEIERTGSEVSNCFNRLETLYKTLKNKNLKVQERLERSVLVGGVNGDLEFQNALGMIKQIGIEIQRKDPAKWNQFLEATLPS